MKRANRLALVLLLITTFFPYLMMNTASSTVTKQDPNPILFIHGMYGSRTNWDNWMSRFLEDGWPSTSLYAFDFDDATNCSAQANINNANQIKQWVANILVATGADKIDLVAHSLGGLSSRYYVKFLAELESIDDYVSLGSPHHGDGDPFPGWCYNINNGMNPLLLLLNEGDETPGGVLNDTVGDRPDPYVEITYNGTHVPGNISYTSIYSLSDEGYGLYGSVIPINTCRLDGATNIALDGLSHTELRTSAESYELVKEAVDDTNIPVTTPQSTGIANLAIFLSLLLGIVMRKKRVIERIK